MRSHRDRQRTSETLLLQYGPRLFSDEIRRVHVADRCPHPDSVSLECIPLFWRQHPRAPLRQHEMKQIVLKRAPVSSNSIWNSDFEDFFNHYGFIPRLCRPYRPQTKGKIENCVGFVKRDFLMGSEFHSFSELNSQAQSWLARVNSTVHGTTNEIPMERLGKEGLRNFDAVPPYHNIREETRKISRDSYVSYLGNRYSVPYRFAGRNCSLQISDKIIHISLSLAMR